MRAGQCFHPVAAYPLWKIHDCVTDSKVDLTAETAPHAVRYTQAGVFAACAAEFPLGHFAM